MKITGQILEEQTHSLLGLHQCIHTAGKLLHIWLQSANVYDYSLTFYSTFQCWEE